jgi:hypothetical protein
MPLPLRPACGNSFSNVMLSNCAFLRPARGIICARDGFSHMRYAGCLFQVSRSLGFRGTVCTGADREFVRHSVPITYHTLLSNVQKMMMMYTSLAAGWLADTLHKAIYDLPSAEVAGYVRSRGRPFALLLSLLCETEQVNGVVAR